MKKKRILFICIENAGRSQIAEAFAKKYGKGIVEVASAGINPAKAIHSEVIEVMKEKGIDLSKNKPKMLNNNLIMNTDFVVTMGCSVEGVCPINKMFKNVINWNLEDPKGKSMDRVREIRDVIEQKVIELIEQVKANVN